MSTSSARPVDLVDYMVETGYQHEAMPSTAELGRLCDAMMRSPNVEWFDACYLSPVAGVEAARNAAKELDTWVGLVATGFIEAGGGTGADRLTVDDAAVVAALPPLLADPPAEVRDRVEEGQALYDALAAACEERDHDRVQEILDEIAERSGDDALMAGVASRIGVDGEDEFEQMVEDGMRPEDREGLLGGLIDFGLGAWDAVWGTVTFVAELSTVRMIIDPAGWAQSVSELGQAAWHGITNPTELIEALIDVDGLRDNPERWFGQFAPDVVLAFFTAGTGTAARRGVAGARALDELGDLSRALRVLDDIDVASDTTHAFRRLLTTFDGDIARSRDALRHYLVDEVGLSPAEAAARADRLAGNEFNRTRRGVGTQLAEVELGPPGTRGPRVDAWDPVEGEIISRKFTQLADVSPSTARSYITELVNKYEPGQEVKLTPTVRRKAEQAGLDPDDLPTLLDGDLVLEVPPQTGRGTEAFQDVLDFASENGVTIRDTDGLVLNP